MAKFFASRTRRSTSAPPRSPGTRRSPSASRSLVAIGLRIVLTRSRIGIAMRAAVDDPLALGAERRPPEPRVDARAGRSAPSLAALGGILIAPTSPSTRRRSRLLIVDAYAAAIFGRLRSLPLTFVGAIVDRPHRGLPHRVPARRTRTCPACASRVPAILLFLVLLVLPEPAPARPHDPQPRVLPDADVARRARSSPARRRRSAASC